MVAFVGGGSPSQSVSDIPPLCIRIYIEIPIDAKRSVSLCAVAFFAFIIVTPIRHLLMSCVKQDCKLPGNGTALTDVQILLFLALPCAMLSIKAVVMEVNRQPRSFCSLF